jgi:predicted acetyltransferase
MPTMKSASALSDRVKVTPATAAERPLIEGLFQFYSYDFSEMEPPGSSDFEFNDEGQFDPYTFMEDYWREPDRWPLLIRLDRRLAGFALVNTHSHHGGRVERNMAEFFVARKYRRGGVASEAVRQILGRYPGRWEVAVVERNTTALAFWPKAIAATPGVWDLTRNEGDGVHWRGPIWTFHSEHH